MDDKLESAPSETKKSADVPGVAGKGDGTSRTGRRAASKKRGLSPWAWAAIAVLACVLIIGGVWLAYRGGPAPVRTGLSAATTGTATSGSVATITSEPSVPASASRAGTPTATTGTTTSVPAQGKTTTAATTWKVVWSHPLVLYTSYKIGWTSAKFPLKAGRIRMVLKLSDGNGSGFEVVLLRSKPSKWGSSLWETKAAAPTPQAVTVTTKPIQIKAGTYEITVQGTANFAISLEQ